MPPKSKAKPTKGAPKENSGSLPAEKGKKKSGSAGAAKGNKAPAVEAPQKDSKTARKAQKQEIEANRLRERDAMMKIYNSSDDEDDQSEEEDRKPASKVTVDKFGNTISKAKLAEDQRIQAMREEARKRREQRGIGVTPTAAVAVVDEASCRPATAEEPVVSDNIVELQEKLASGLKLTHREKRAIHLAEKNALSRQMEAEADAQGLSSFSLQVIRGTGTSSEDDQATASATDIIVPSFTITAPSRPLLVDTSLRIVSGRKYGLLGPNGRGKTTLLKFIAARQLPVPRGVDVLLVQQEVVASAVPVVDQVLATDKKRADLLCEEEELQSEFEVQESILVGEIEHEGANGKVQPWTDDEWTEKLNRFAEIGVELESSGADACEAKVRRILTGLGFSDAMQNGPSTSLSGGWRMRVALASALFLEPKLLLLDEPTNHLDLNAVLWLDDYLSSQWSGSLLIVSHDADFLESVCTDIIHLDANKLNYYSGSFSNFEGMRGQIESRKERNYKLQQKTVKEFKAQGLTVEKAERRAISKLGITELVEPPKEYRVNFTFKPSEDTQPSGVDMLDVSFAYNASRQLFENLRLRVDGHSRVAIVGPNGSGKSSLLRLLTGSLEPTKGEVLRHSRLRLGRYDQHFEELLPYHKTPAAYLTEEFDITINEARKYLGMFGLDGARHMIRIDQLSGGQKARCVFAALALKRPHVLILDEPTNHLDMESVEALIESLRRFEGGVVLVSHDARLISALDCELWVCGDSSSGLRVERRGFDRYRIEVLKEVRRREEVAHVEAEKRMRRKREARDRILAQRRSKRSAAGTSKSSRGSVFRVDVS